MDEREQVKNKCGENEIQVRERSKEVTSFWDALMEFEFDSMKHPGIVIDDKLQFRHHCDYTLKRIGKKQVS